METIAETRRYEDGIEDPKVSVVVVTYRAYSELKDCLDGLAIQTNHEFETILVDNGVGVPFELRPYGANCGLTYIRLKNNFGPSFARNLGTLRAKSEIVIFLEDDAVPQQDIVAVHLKAYQSGNIIGLRSKVKPKSGSLFNSLQSHYDLGDQVAPYFADIAGGTSFKREALMEVGGFNEKLFGGEESDLSYRILANFGDRIVYHPESIIYHDFADGLSDYLEKRFRHARARDSISPEALNLLARFAHQVARPRRETHSGFMVRLQLKVVRIMGGWAQWAGRHWPNNGNPFPDRPE